MIDETLGKFILTSQGFYGNRIIPFVESLTCKMNNKSAVIITTAADEREKCKYNMEDFKTLKSIGFKNVDFVDLEKKETSHVSNCDLIYVGGGNTFRLIKAARESYFKKTIEGVIGAGGIYLGVSCGSLIIGPSILLAEEFTDDNQKIKMTDFSGLGLIPYIVMHHYDDFLEDRLVAFEKKHGVTLLRLRDGEAYVFDFVAPKGQWL